MGGKVVIQASDGTYYGLDRSTWRLRPLVRGSSVDKARKYIGVASMIAQMRRLADTLADSQRDELIKNIDRIEKELEAAKILDDVGVTDAPAQ